MTLISHRALALIPLGALLAGCPTPEPVLVPTAADVTPSHGWEAVPTDRPGWRVGLTDLAPAEYRYVPEWREAQWGAKRPRTTWRAEDQTAPPIRWDRVEILEDGRVRDGAERYAVWHGNGCCGGCQTVATLGAVLTQHRIDRRRPIEGRRTLPHRAVGSWRDDELALRTILATSRQSYIRGGRDVPQISSALAIVGAPLRRATQSLVGDDPWTPARLCRALAGRDIPVLRARVRRFDVRFMTVALQEGPVVISGSFKDLVRSEEDLFRCGPRPENPSRHHFMLVIGWETLDTDDDGDPDEVVWLARDDWNHRGRDHRDLDRDTWEDAWLDDEWMRIVPRGCLLERGTAYSVIPGTVTLGSFDNPTVPGPHGTRVSFCEADPDRDGVTNLADLCPFTPDPDQSDRDGDGTGDACDPCPDAIPVERVTQGHYDRDHDWIADACDPCPDDPDDGCR